MTRAGCCITNIAAPLFVYFLPNPAPLPTGLGKAERKTVLSSLFILRRARHFCIREENLCFLILSPLIVGTFDPVERPSSSHSNSISSKNRSSLRWKKKHQRLHRQSLSPQNLRGLALAGRSSDSRRCFLPLMSPGASPAGSLVGQETKAEARNGCKSGGNV